MKTRLRIIACMVSLAFLLAVTSALAQADKLIGVWKVTEITYSGENASTITTPQPGLFIFTKKHYSWQSVDSEKPRPNPPDENATVAQLEAVYGPFTSNGGIYEIKGSTIVIHPMVAKMPFVMRMSLNIDFKFEGDELILTAQELGRAYKLIRLE